MGLFSWLFGSSSTPTPEPEPEPDAPPEPCEYVVWSARDSASPGGVEWKKADGVFTSEDEAYQTAAEIANAGGVREVRVLKSDRPAPKAGSPILAGRAAESPEAPTIQSAQRFTFNNDGTMQFESKGGGTYTYRYTIDGDELWIVWEFNGRYDDQVYHLTREGFHIVRSKQRGKKEWYEYKDLEPYQIYKYVT